MLTPALAFVAVFIAYPLLRGFYKSFFDYNGGNVDRFVGMKNYIELFNDPAVLPSFVNVFWLTVALMLNQVGVAFIAAWLIHHLRSARLQYAFRIVVMVPAVVPTIVGFLIWSQFLSVDGAVNRILGALGAEWLIGNWLGDPDRVIIGLILVGLPWLNGINCLLFLAGLENIPGERYEAARLDRASRWQILRYMEIPAVLPQMIVLGVLAVVLSLQSYENVYVLTGGGPFDSSNVPGLLLFKNAFTYGRFGYANAIGVLLVVVIAVILLAGRMLGRGGEDR
ncbi:carbohydrate ABC transporter permease [Ruania rhizosphaerae]|uniref:carbohydrate ABC transporter permease n=1 Tax=Ruania rhizosphaerae TaxID=1840413 RepID=UPI00135CBC93|nr:sugar ABC transporter permease [Ruania rhizosphaerae]